MTLLLGVLLWLGFLTVLALILRGARLAPGIIMALGLAVLAWQLWQLPTEGVAQLFGRTVSLETTNQLFGFEFQLTTLARGPLLILLIWGALFAFASAWTDADRGFVPVLPVVIAAFTMALSSTPLLWSPLWLVIAAIVMSFAAQGSRPRPARAALRVLIAPILALPFFLFAAWVLGQQDIARQDPALWTNAWRALLVGVALLLTPVPLHGWITALGEYAPPFAAAFYVGAWQLAVYAIVRSTLLTYPLLGDFVDPARWLPIIAAIQMVWAGIFGLFSQRLGQMFGYLLLWDFGATYLLWSVTGEFGTQSMAWLMLARPLMLLLLATGVRGVTQRFDLDPKLALLHGGARLPVTTLALVGGALFLLGWPLGALFPIRLSTLQLTELVQPRIFVWAMASLLLLTISALRLLHALARPVTDPDLQRESPRVAWLVLPVLLIGIILSINPGVLDTITTTIVNWMSQL